MQIGQERRMAARLPRTFADPGLVGMQLVPMKTRDKTVKLTEAPMPPNTDPINVAQQEAQLLAGQALHSSTTAPAAPALVEVRDLHVTYGSLTAVRGISFIIHQGEIFGLLGPNGAGKTTTLSCLEGLKKPSSGHITIGGLDIVTHARQVKELLGIQLQSTALLPSLTCFELIRLYAALYRVYLSRNEILKLLQRFDLGDKARSRAGQLSGGQQQRLALAIALANRPQIVLLDEPTTGLDPQNRHAVWDMIAAIRAEGHTVLLTTHYMEEAEVLCDRLAIIDHGEIIAEGSPHELVTQTLGAASVLTIEGSLPVDRIEALSGVLGVTHIANRLEIYTSSVRRTQSALRKLARSLDVPLDPPVERKANLEDVFLKLTGRALRS
jgi:ABC-2 type transport system ATP-binding protein